MKTLLPKTHSLTYLLRIAVLLLSAAFISACSDDDDDHEPLSVLDCSGTLVDIADCDANFDTLASAVEAADLVDTLNSSTFTVFAPTDAAFEELFQALGVTAEEFLQRDDLGEILTYHVLSGAVDSTAAVALAGMMDNTAVTVQTASVTLSLDGGELYVNRSQVVTPNVMADNGIIHVIDKVLVPPDTFNIVETAQADGRFNTLVAAVVEAGLATTLATTPNLTVFAPTDDAFADLIASNPAFSSAADILALSNLGDILQYHVLASEVDALAAIGLAGNTTTPLLSSESLALSYVDPTLWINTSAVVIADVDASNGIVHAIDKVLLPPTASELSDTNASIAEIVTTLAGSANPEFTTLLAALQQEGLDTALDGAGPFTVFAPTDAAFAAVGDVATILGLANLSDILSQHVISGSAIDSITAYTANGTSVATLLPGTSLDVAIEAGELQVGNATVVVTDVEAENGVIHVIDAVITDPNP